MEIISHRGYWITEKEKNKKTAFKRSFSLGFGTETDIRDFNGEIVISHDFANKNSIPVKDIFTLYNKYNALSSLALNIKADGLQEKLKEAIQYFSIQNYFVFDMSVPDTIGHMKYGIRFFSRQSEFEMEPIFYNQCAGIWLDCFNSIWYSSNLISTHIKNNKTVAIVSPDLHKRDPEELWEFLRKTKIHHSDNIILCTDIPEKAINYFQ